MTGEELDNWNICLERPDAKVMKDVIFDYFENQLLTCDGCKYYLSDNGYYTLGPCSECSRFYLDQWKSKQ